MARSRAHEVARLGRCLGAATLLVIAATASARAEQGAGAGAHDAGHSPPPAASASEKAPPAHGEHPPTTATRRGADRKDDASRIARGSNPPLDRRSKLGAPDIGDARVAPALPQIPRLSARDRLFKLMLAAKPRPPARLRPPNPATPSMPMRNAIGVRIDPGAAARTTTTAHWGQRPARLATVGTTPMAAPPSVTNGWHPAAVPAPAARGALNGTTLVRIGSGAPVIGGPAKVVTGINGTTLRPKHQ